LGQEVDSRGAVKKSFKVQGSRFKVKLRDFER
jgi:hypothetical protein